MKKLIRKLIPKSALDNLHYAESLHYARRHGHPTEKMVVIGIVGSKGKTTTANMIWAALSASGAKVGLIGTANIRVGAKEEMNKYHMTMPGAPAMQKILAGMKKAGCGYVVMEVPSEAQTQWRHIGINFDVLVFTNVEREIMASHRGSMEVLHQHNKRVFSAMQKSAKKIIAGKIISKIIITNADSNDSKAYSDFGVDKIATYSVDAASNYQAKNIKSSAKGVNFTIGQDRYHINLPGSINASNAAAAVAVASELGVEAATISKGLSDLGGVPGRMERIEAKQPFTVMVDYAHSPASMKTLMASAHDIVKDGAKVITLLGSEGGGRDIAKQPIMGEIAGKGSDYVIVSNVDPYEDDPATIIEGVAKGVRKAGLKDDKNLFCIEDRRAGIAKALSIASKGDLVLITGKGAEQSIVIGGVSSPWDDRKVVREELKKLQA